MRTKLTAAVVAIAAHAITGCGPADLHECNMAAAKMPTGQGAVMATKSCSAKFAPPVQQIEFIPVTPAPTAPPPTEAQAFSSGMTPQAARIVMDRHPYLDTIANGAEVQEYIVQEALKKVAAGMEPDLALQQTADIIAPHYRPK